MSMNFDCPSCGASTPRLIIYTDPRKLGCPSCGVPKAKRVNVNLGQTADKWVAPNGKTHRISVGKVSEIESRRISPDDYKSVTTKNGRKPEY